MKGFKRVLHFPEAYDVRLTFQSHEDFVENLEDAVGAVAWFEYTEDTRHGGIVYIDSSRTLEDILGDLDHEIGHVLVEWREHWRKVLRERAKVALTGNP